MQFNSNLIKPKNNVSQNINNNISLPNNSIPPLNKMLAKFNENNSINVFTHCLIVGMVARELIKRQTLNLNNTIYPKGSALIAALHDIGKVYPHFQKKIYTENNLDYSDFNFDSINTETEKQWGYHAGVSQITLDYYLKTKNINDKYISKILGRHHGTSPNFTNFGSPHADAHVLGGKLWLERRIELIENLIKIFAEPIPIIDTDSLAAALSGLTSVADWIGSSIVYKDIDTNNYELDLQKLQIEISNNLDSIGFLNYSLQTNLEFSDIFKSYTPHQFQQKVINIVNDRGVYIIESNMGSGKTEAALFAAYTLLIKGLARGIYFALPTKLTSDKIYQRFNYFLNIIGMPESFIQSLLIYSSSGYFDLSEINAEGDREHEWFHSSRKAIIAPFAVGTIDQALMAVLNVKFGFVRSFGLSGKVVIIDEVHTYDSYTGSILDKLIFELKELGCTIIILSATLTEDRKYKILNTTESVNKVHQVSYPLITSLKESKNTPEYYSVDSQPDSNVSVKFVEDDRFAIEEVIRRAQEGQQVIWYENTVSEAQEQYKIIGANIDKNKIILGLIHSQFIRCDRNVQEEEWTQYLGKGGKQKRNKMGSILIGTQVLEQSLDIDADFMISRLSPSDMLLQRIGRLWRHKQLNDIRPKNAMREIFVLVPSQTKIVENAEIAFGKSGFVYSPYVLARTYEVWKSKFRIELPSEIRDILEQTYIEREETYLSKVKKNQETEVKKLCRMARINMSEDGTTTQLENQVTTRYSEQETVELLLLKNYKIIENKLSLTFLDNTILEIQKNDHNLSKQDKMNITLNILQQVVNISENKAPEYFKNIDILSYLKPYVYLGNKDYRPFRIAVVQDSGSIILNGYECNSKYNLFYSKTLGYQAKKQLKNKETV